MNSHGKKMVAPIIITAILVLYFILYFTFLVNIMYGWFRIVFGIIPVAMAAVMIMVCIERIKEIKKGEEDDISKY